MFLLGVFYQLVFTIVLNSADFAYIRLMVSMSSDVIVPVTNSCEALVTVVARVRLFTGMNPHVNDKITSLVKTFITKRAQVSLGLSDQW